MIAPPCDLERRGFRRRPSEPPQALPGWIVELSLPEPARLLLAILWRWRTRKGLVNPSVATLSNILGGTQRTVQRYVALLEGQKPPGMATCSAK
jgi:hypothetical protein